jgi:hypothetical protein
MWSEAEALSEYGVVPEYFILFMTGRDYTSVDA